MRRQLIHSQLFNLKLMFVVHRFDQTDSLKLTVISASVVLLSLKCVATTMWSHIHTFTLPLSAMTPYPIAWLPPISKWGPSYRLATQEQWAPRRGNGSSKGQVILWRWREGWRDGSQGGERRRWGVMGMVWGHIFNHVTKREAAWETRLCFSNPAGRFCSTLLRSSSLSLSQLEQKKKQNKWKRAMVVVGPQHLNLTYLVCKRSQCD